MSLALKTNPTLSKLSHRAELLFKIRQFFVQRNVMEVETPLLCRTTATDPHIASLKTTINNEKYYLQTSPEFAMKKLLASGSGAIYQICKAFRDEPGGRFHNPEFTMLEWYRPGFDHHQLMDEIDGLMFITLETKPAKRFTYRNIFLQLTDIDPFSTNINKLKQYADNTGIAADNINTTDGWLDIIFTLKIQPNLIEPTFIYDYPTSQAALSKIRNDDPPVAERFELFIKGVELANGYHELSDPKEQRQRFIKDNELRQKMKLETIPIDETLIAALDNHFPSCAGVAFGLDRLLMLMSQAEKMTDVINFTIEEV